MSLQITAVRAIKGAGNLVAGCSVVINEVQRVNGIKLFHDETRGYNVGMPAQQGADKRWYPQFRYLDRKIQADFEEQILSQLLAHEDLSHLKSPEKKKLEPQF